MNYKSKIGSDDKLCPFDDKKVVKDDCNNCFFYWDCVDDWK